MKIDNVRHFAGTPNLPSPYRDEGGPYELGLFELEWLYERYDVMLFTTTAGEHWIMLDDAGKRFRQR